MALNATEMAWLKKFQEVMTAVVMEGMDINGIDGLGPSDEADELEANAKIASLTLGKKVTWEEIVEARDE